MILVIGSESNLAKNFIKKYRGESQLFLTSRRDQNKFKLDLNSYNNEIKSLPSGIKNALIFAGISSLELCQNNADLVKKINYEKTFKLIKDLNKRKIRCLFLSSNCVFSEATNSTSEYSIRNPNNVYGFYKKKVEDKILDSNLNSVVRLTKVLDQKSDLVFDWIKKIKNEETIEAFDNIKISPISRNFVSDFINDWCSNIYNQNIFHLSSDIEISYFDLAKIIAKKTSSKFNNFVCTKADISNVKFYSPVKSNLECKLEHSRYENFDKFIKSITKF